MSPIRPKKTACSWHLQEAGPPRAGSPVAHARRRGPNLRRRSIDGEVTALSVIPNGEQALVAVRETRLRAKLRDTLVFVRGEPIPNAREPPEWDCRSSALPSGPAMESTTWQARKPDPASEVSPDYNLYRLDSRLEQARAGPRRREGLRGIEPETQPGGEIFWP